MRRIVLSVYAASVAFNCPAGTAKGAFAGDTHITCFAGVAAFAAVVWVVVGVNTYRVTVCASRRAFELTR